MFIFMEGENLDFDLPINVINYNIRISTELTFNEAIEILASKSIKNESDITVFINFFSVGCSTLSDAQKRGLERIAGSYAIEIINNDMRVTQFLTVVNRKDFDMSVLDTILDIDKSHGIGFFRRCNTLIVGESPGPNSNGYNIPFVGSGCGIWLLKQLDLNEISETNIYWVNAKNEHDVYSSYDFITQLNPSRIITLGKEAKQWAAQLSQINVINLPHPQYWLRFRSKEEYPLLRLLKL